MATLPRSLRFAVETSQRPVSDFDAGINTSTAWTGRLEGANADDVTPKSSLSKASSRKYLSESNAVHSMSDAEVDDDSQEIAHPARALYAFEGKAEFRELTVEADDELEVVKENVGEGWSLVKDSTGEIGLLPRSYYTVRVSTRMVMILIL
jgi:sorting nexin-9/18/33